MGHGMVVILSCRSLAASEREIISMLAESSSRAVRQLDEGGGRGWPMESNWRLCQCAKSDKTSSPPTATLQHYNDPWNLVAYPSLTRVVYLNGVEMILGEHSRWLGNKHKRLRRFVWKDLSQAPQEPRNHKMDCQNKITTPLLVL